MVNESFTGRTLLDSARKLSVDAVVLRDVVDLIDALDRERRDPDTNRVLSQLREMASRDREISTQLKLIALSLDGSGNQDRVARIDEVLEARALQHDTARAMGGWA